MLYTISACASLTTFRKFFGFCFRTSSYAFANMRSKEYLCNDKVIFICAFRFIIFWYWCAEFLNDYTDMGYITDLYHSSVCLGMIAKFSDLILHSEFSDLGLLGILSLSFCSKDWLATLRSLSYTSSSKKDENSIRATLFKPLERGHGFRWAHVWIRAFK